MTTRPTRASSRPFGVWVSASSVSNGAATTPSVPSILVAVVAVLLLGVPFAIISRVAGNELTGWMSVAVIAGLGVVAVAAACGRRHLAQPAVHPADGRARRARRDARLRPCPAALKPSGIAEVDRVCELLNRSGDRIDRLIAAERQFASDASHQLRTPLTALSMRLEEIVQADDPRIVKEEAAVRSPRSNGW